jgi:uncharacterized membrane protein
MRPSVADGRRVKARQLAELAGILALGIVARILLAAYRSMWFDEAFSWRVAQFPVTEMCKRIVSGDNSPPLFFVLLKIWVWFFGDSLFIMRLLSIYLGGVTMGAAYLFWIEAFGRERARFGLLAAFLIAISSSQVRWGAEVRMYALGTAIAVLTSWMLLRALRNGGRSIALWIQYAVFCLAFAYTHYYAFFTLAAHGCYIFTSLVIRAASGTERAAVCRAARNSLLATGFVVACFTPWSAKLLQQRQQVGREFWNQSIDGASVPAAIYHLFLEPPRFERPGHVPSMLAGVALTIICLAAIMVCLHRPAPGDYLVVMCASLPFALAMAVSVSGRSIFFYRYLLFSHVFILIAIARAVSKFPTPAARPLAVSLLMGMSVFAWRSWSVVDVLGRPGLRAAVEFIERERGPDDVVLACAPAFYLPLSYHSRGRFPVHVFFRKGEGRSHFDGTAALTAADYLMESDIAQLGDKQLWTVDGNGCAPPGNWKLVGSFEFAEAAVYEGFIVVQQFVSSG